MGRCGGWGVTQVEPLGLVQLLLHLEDVEVEVLLQLLVGEVDQQLLEAIVLKDLEAEDVEDADLRRRRRAASAVSAALITRPSNSLALSSFDASPDETAVADSGISSLGAWRAFDVHRAADDALFASASTPSSRPPAAAGRRRRCGTTPVLVALADRAAQPPGLSWPRWSTAAATSAVSRTSSAVNAG